MWGSIQAICPSVSISCSPDLFCFWLAARCNHQLQGNLIIPGPDLDTLDRIATTFDQCIKTLTLTLSGHDLLGACVGRGWGVFTTRDYFPSAACWQLGQSAWGLWGWGFMDAASPHSHFSYPISVASTCASCAGALTMAQISFIAITEMLISFKQEWLDCERSIKFIKIKKAWDCLVIKKASSEGRAK